MTRKNKAITGEELHAEFAAEGQSDPDSKANGDGDAEDRPGGGLSKANFMKPISANAKSIASSKSTVPMVKTQISGLSSSN